MFSFSCSDREYPPHPITSIILCYIILYENYKYPRDGSINIVSLT